MSLRDVLSANLTRLCERERSIASVCRATRINRQQFNRYLAGDSLPNRRNLEKICRYFELDEPELFRETGTDLEKGRADPEAPWSHGDFRATLKSIHSEVQTSIAPGLYFAHFAIPQDKNSIMRSAMVVRNDGNLSTFRRLTGLSEPKGSWWSHFHGDHKGVILERLHWLYFIGLNVRGTREPTLLALRWVPISEPMLGGQAMILTPSGPTITAVVVNPCQATTSLRSAIRASHVYSTDDPDIDPMIVDALDQQCHALSLMVSHLDLSVRPLP